MKTLCNYCPRGCNVDRTTAVGFCGASNTLCVSKVMLHHFEEPIISGENEKSAGSGAIFFSFCGLRCCYCQNSEISRGKAGKEITTSELAEIFKKLEEQGAYNINLVTPTHFTEQILEALKLYRPKIPVVWNTSGYETPQTIERLKGYVDIFLTDMKYFDSKYSLKYSGAKDYFEYASKSLLKMRELQPDDVIKDGLMKKGIIVRHLVLPGLTKDSLKILDWINGHLGNQTYLSLMSQYVPMADAKKYPEINRKISPLEYKVLVARLNELGFSNAFVQDFESADTVFTPDFDKNDDTF